MNGAWFPMFFRDFLAATAGWTAEERGHYFVLLGTQWEQGGLPDDVRRLELISPGLRGSWRILEPKFPVWADGLRRNPRLERERVEAAARSEKVRSAASRAAAARWHISDAPRNASGNASGNASRNAAAYAETGEAAGNGAGPVAEADAAPAGRVDAGSEEKRAVLGDFDGSAAGRDASGNAGRNAPRNASGNASAMPSTSTMYPPPPPPPHGGEETGDPGDPGGPTPWSILRDAWNAEWGPARQWQATAAPPEAVARLAEPGWLEDALRAIPQIKRGACAGWKTPPTLRQFCATDAKRGSFVARLLGGEFRDKPREPPGVFTGAR